MFPITVTVNNSAQLSAVIAALGHPAVDTPQTAEAGTKGATPPKSVKGAPAPSPSPTTAQAAAAPASTGAASGPAAASAPAPSPASIAVTYADHVKPLILKINTDKGREAATNALATFGVTKGPDLKPEQYAEFVAHAKELLGETAGALA